MPTIRASGAWQSVVTGSVPVVAPPGNERNGMAAHRRQDRRRRAILFVASTLVIPGWVKAGVVNDGSLAPVPVAKVGGTFQIAPASGLQRGGNLFYSFS